jgi:hypothetical protein
MGSSMRLVLIEKSSYIFMRNLDIQITLFMSLMAYLPLFYMMPIKMLLTLEETQLVLDQSLWDRMGKEITDLHLRLRLSSDSVKMIL